MVNTPNGGLLVALEKRETIDPAQFEKERPKLESRALETRRRSSFTNGSAQRRRQAGVPETKSPYRARIAAGLPGGDTSGPGLGQKMESV